MRLPSKSPVTLAFKATTSPYSIVSPHMGVDFAYLPDDVIYAPFSGIVIQVPNNGNDGNGTYMYNGPEQFHGMLHASHYLVPNGSTVSEGQPIAVMGATGFAQGVHLHWCIKQNGQFIDPLSLLKEEEMLTTTGAEVLHRFLLGEAPSGFTLDNRVGKMTFDEAFADIKATDRYKQHAVVIKAATNAVVDHLPTDMR